MQYFQAKYVVIWSDKSIAGFDSYLKLNDYLDRCVKAEDCANLEHKVFLIENNKIEELDL